jgi:hypothetical protein
MNSMLYWGFLIMIYGITFVALYINILGVLDSKGYKVNFLWNYFGQLKLFYKIIKQEKNLNIRKKYKWMLYSFLALIIPFYLLWITLAVLGIMLIVSH